MLRETHKYVGGGVYVAEEVLRSKDSFTLREINRLATKRANAKILSNECLAILRYHTFKDALKRAYF